MIKIDLYIYNFRNFFLYPISNISITFHLVVLNYGDVFQNYKDSLVLK